CGRRPINGGGLLLLLWRFGRDRDFVTAGFPFSEILFGEFQSTLSVNIADQENGGVFRAIVSTVKLMAVLVLIGHVLDVLYEAHRGVLVRVSGESFIPKNL